MPAAIEEVEERRRWTAERLARASYKDLGSPAQVEERFLRHLLSLESCQSALEVLLTATSKTTRDFSLEMDAFDLLEADPVLGHLLLRFPSTLLPILENAIVSAQKELSRKQPPQPRQRRQEGDDDNNDNDNDNDEAPTPPIMLVKGDKTKKGLPATRVHARLVHLPPTCCRHSVAAMEAKDVGKIVQLSGTVVRTSPVQMYESARTYKCTGKNGCSRTFVQFADLEQRTNALVKPDRCPLLLESGQRCKGTNLPLEKDGSVHTDYQEIKIQEAGKYTKSDWIYFLCGTPLCFFLTSTHIKGIIIVLVY
jgi:DNA replicative helicase MCM subunit Mcm2 (Cdc46/Mcm family)